MTCLSRLSVLASACNSWLLASNSAVNSAGLPPSPLDLIIKTRLGQGRALLLPRKKPSDLGTDSGNTAVLYIQSTAKSSDRDQKADWCCFSLTPSVRCQGMIALESWKDRVAVIWCYLCILQHQGCAQPQAELRACFPGRFHPFLAHLKSSHAQCTFLSVPQHP